MIADPTQAGSLPPRDDSTPGPEAFDALADLFLGEIGQVAAHDMAVGVPPRPPKGTGATHLKLAWSEDDPRPCELREKARGDEIEAMMPVTETVTAAGTLTPEAAPAQSLTIESLILGHLPVMASAWAAQYARSCAEQADAPVGLVRVASGQMRIEVHRPPTPEGQAIPERVAPHSDLGGALESLRRTCSHVVVHVEASQELNAAAHHASARVTLLTSADEAGVVAAYSTVKSLVRRLENDRGLAADSVLRVVVMGAPEARAKYVWSRLHEAAQTFLGVHLHPAACISRIGGGTPAAMLYVGEAKETLADLMGMLAIGPTSEAAAGVEVNASATLVLAEEEDDVAEVADAADTDRTDEGEAADAADVAGIASDDAALVEPDDSATDAFEPAAMDYGDAAVSTDDSPRTQPASLAAHVPGLLSLAARCPLAEEVELAIDGAGQLHVLGAAMSDADHAGTVGQLTVAAAWATLNRRVLAMTLPTGQRFVSAGSPAMHLFTDQVSRHRGLLDSAVRVHLLASAAKASKDGWLVAAVN